MDATKDILQIKWHELKTKVHKHWAKLTNEDLAQVNGNSEELVRVLRKRYGYGKAQAEIEISEWLTDLYQEDTGLESS